MAQNETGHYKNVANFKKLCAHVRSFSKYNPARDALKVPQLLAQHDAADAMMSDLHTATTAETKARKERSVLFKAMPEFATRIVAELEASVPDSSVLPQARHQSAKIHGARIGKKPVAETTPPATQESAAGTQAGESTPAESPKSHSASQRSIDAMLDHLDKLITVIEGEPNYLSAYPDLQPIALRTYWDTAKQLDRTAVDTNVVASNMRNLRTEQLYHESTGIVQTARSVKKSMLVAYTAQSSEYKQIKSISFRKLKSK